MNFHKNSTKHILFRWSLFFSARFSSANQNAVYKNVLVFATRRFATNQSW